MGYKRGEKRGKKKAIYKEFSLSTKCKSLNVINKVNQASDAVSVG